MIFWCLQIFQKANLFFDKLISSIMCVIFLIGPILEARAEILTKKVHLLGDLKTPKNHSEINWIYLAFTRSYFRTTVCLKANAMEILTIYYYFNQSQSSRPDENTELFFDWLKIKIVVDGQNFLVHFLAVLCKIQIFFCWILIWWQ